MNRLSGWWRTLSDTARLRWKIFAVLAMLAFVFSLVGLVLSADWAGLWLNLATELIGAAVTFLLIDQVIGRKERLDAEEQSKTAQQIMALSELRSATTEEVRHAVLDKMLQLDLLEGAYLDGLDLQRAYLTKVHRFRTPLPGQAPVSDWRLELGDERVANMRGAYIRLSNLTLADLTLANLEEAKLGGTNLQYALLSEASLQRAHLESANL